MSTLHLGLLASSLLVVALAVTPIYDETLWTKVTWHKWKIDSSLLSISPSEETPGILAQYGLKDVLHNSLEGPSPREIKKAPKEPAVDAEAFNDDSFLPAAAMAVKCSVCHALMVRVWQRLVDDVLRGELSLGQIPYYAPKYLTDACENEVPQLLQRKLIYRLDMASNDQKMTFFVLRNRKPGTNPTQLEYAAVKTACAELLTYDQKEFVKQLNAWVTEFKHSVNRALRIFGMRPPPDDNTEPDESTGAGHAGSPAASSQSGSSTGSEGSQAGGLSGTEAGGVTEQQGQSSTGQRKGGVGDSYHGEHLIDVPEIAEKDLPVPKKVLQSMVTKLLKGVAAKLRKEAHTVRMQALDDMDQAPATSKKQEEDDDDDEDEYEDPDDMDDEDEEEEVDEEGEPCRDLHPMCEQWANEGECDANPNYMVGNARLKGHCRKACGVCQPSTLSTAEEVLAKLPVLSESIRTLNKVLIKALRNQACTKRHACFVGGDEVASHGNVITAKAPGYANVLQTFKGVPHGSGFVLGRPYWGQPEVKVTPQSREAQRKAEEWEQKLEESRADHQGSEEPSELSKRLSALRLKVHEVLDKELGGKLLQLHEEFFTYEYLFHTHVRQFHDEPRHSGKQITEEWSLGKYLMDSVIVDKMLEPLDMLPAQHPHDPGYGMSQRSWRYVKHLHTNGDRCELEGGRRSVRRTEVRIACSPDSNIHMLLREPDFCQYIFVIYSPALCTIERYKPVPLGHPVWDD